MFGFKPALRVPLDDKDNNEKVKHIFSKEKNDLCLSWIRPPRAITMQSEAYYGETYEDLFVTRNFITNSHFNNDLTGWDVSAGEPSISTEVYNTPSKSLKLFGAISQQVRNTIIPARSKVYYVAVKVRLDRYAAGAGIGFQATRTDSGSTIAVNTVTDGFVTLSRIYTSSADYDTWYLTIGTITSADIDGYMDDVVAVDITDLLVYNPTTADLDELYENYLKIVNGTDITLEETRNYRITSLEKISTFPSEVAISAFLEMANIKAEELGMENSTLSVPHAFYSSAYDLIKMAVHASGYNELVKIWNKKSYTFKTKGVNPREVTVATTVTSASLEDYYYIFGGKTGTGSATQQTLVVLVNAPDGNVFVGAIIENETDRFIAMKELFDIATECVTNSSFTPPGEMTLTATNFAVALLPHGNPLLHAGYDIPLLHKGNEEVLKLGASTAKLMTAMVTLDYADNINEHLEITADDLVDTPDPYFEVGDIISFKDALHVMLLPSSNNAARALARVVGTKILNAY